MKFRDEEIVTRKQKIEGEWVTKLFPVVGGRLRLAHESNESLSITTEILSNDPEAITVKARITSGKGIYDGTGTATVKRDARLAKTLIELAETRAIARALRFAGYGVEYCSAEEVDHIDSDLSVIPETSPDIPPPALTVEALINAIPDGLERRGVPKKKTAEATEAALYLIKEKFEVVNTEDIPEDAVDQLREFMHGPMVERLEKFYMTEGK